MTERRYRVLVICSHPVQYTVPYLRRLAQHPRVDLLVAYCTMRGAVAGHDPEFGATVKWDVPLLDGYQWVQIPNKGSGNESFWGLNNPGLWKLIRDGEFDAVFCHASYVCASFWIARVRALLSKVPFVFGTDSTTLNSINAKAWKKRTKKLLWPYLFRSASQVIVASTATRDLMLSLGIPAGRISFTPSSVDNDWWLAQSAKVNRDEVRDGWSIPREAFVVLYCAKLQPWKRPQDLLHAFALLDSEDTFLVIAGEGPLRGEMQKEAANLGISERCRFLGFVNQSQLPAVYTASDVLVLPSSYETFGLVINEAYLCGCPAVVSDRVGAARDLVAPVDPGLIYPCRNVEVLSQILRKVSQDRELCRGLGMKARVRMTNWSPDAAVAGIVQAVEACVGVESDTPG